jgi:hypothetical protein
MDPNEAAKRGNYGEERFEKVEFQLKVREAFKKIIGSTWMHIGTFNSYKESHL